jgi:hypothetical protein
MTVQSIVLTLAQEQPPAAIALTVNSTVQTPAAVVVGIQGPAGVTGPQGPQGSQGSQGLQGDTGPQGEQGPTGAAGIDGIDGAVWYHGNGTPSDELGVDGDYYLDALTGDTYQHGGSVGWNWFGNLRGPQGQTGATGPQGETGPQGAAANLTVSEDYTVVSDGVNQLDFIARDFSADYTSDGAVQITLGAAILRNNETRNLSVGYTATAENLGSIGGGTTTPDPRSGNLKRYLNTGAHSLAAPSVDGDYTMVIQVTNDTGAGLITLSGFSKTGGDSFTTTVGHDFFVFITKINGFTSASVQALQ